jgi:osmotically-inducible protein OsmY
VSDERHAQGDDDSGLVIGPASGGSDVESVPRAFVTRGGVRGDAEIAADVQRRLGEHGSFDATGVRVTVDHGNVRLEGTVSDEPASRVAALIADAVPGVREVENRLTTCR